MSVQPFTPPGVLTANALAGQTIPGALGVTGAVNAGPLSAPVWELQAATPVAGTALVNGTPTIITWTAPSDGKLHRVFVTGALLVTTLEAGGLVQVQWTGPGGATANFTQLYAAGLAAATAAYASSEPSFVIAAGSTVNVNQASALTSGAATLWAEIWGS